VATCFGLIRPSSAQHSEIYKVQSVHFMYCGIAYYFQGENRKIV